MQTRKYPRTLQEAFGPYTDNRIEEKQEPMHPADKLILKTAAFVIVALYFIFNAWG